MEEITVNIGELVTGNSGIANDTRQFVQFTGEKLGEYTEYGTDHRGNITDTRGRTEQLFRVDDGRLVVHVHEWSRWVGEPDTESLVTVTEKTLGPTGLFRQLGAACGFGRPLTLDEAGPVEWPESNTEAPAVRLTSSGALGGIEEEAPEVTLTVRIDASDSELNDAISDFLHELNDWGVHLCPDEHPLTRLRLALLAVRSKD